LGAGDGRSSAAAIGDTSRSETDSRQPAEEASISKDEISLLEALQLRASLVAPDYREALAEHPDAIELPVADVLDGRVRVAITGHRVAGFSVVLPLRGTSCELDGLFVEPDVMGHGIGRALIDDVVGRARPLGVVRLDVIANPTAFGFYIKLGFHRGEDAVTRFGPAFWMYLNLGPLPA
jgi:GNAT superfamily N-acetyltransferase